MAKEDQKEDEKLVPVGDSVETSEKEEESKKPAKSAADEDSDEKVGHAEEASDDEEDDEEGEVSPERQRIRERRKREKLNRQRRISSDRRELDFLRKRNEQVEQELSKVRLRQDKVEDASVDGRIGILEGQIREAEEIHGKAVDAKDGATATEALRVRDQLRDALGQLKGGKETRQKERKEEQQRAAQADSAPDTEAVILGREWVSKNGWFDPKLGDEDSFLVRAIEERMAREGRLDPATPEYWEEFDRRIDKKFPNLRKEKTAKDADDEDVEWDEDDEKPQKKTPEKKRGGPRIAIGGKTRSLKPNEVYLSEQRIQALKEAGVYDDPEKLQRYLKAYKRYDEEALRNS